MLLRKTFIYSFITISIPFTCAIGALPTLTQDTLKTATLHMPFIHNQGQIKDPAVAYYADTFACRVSVTKGGQLVYGLSGNGDSQALQNQTIHEYLVNATTRVTGQGKAPTQVNYTIGNDPGQWFNAIPCFEHVDMGQIHPGIRLKLKAHANNVEKLFYIAPGADPGQIQLAVDGIQTLQVNPQGELELISPAGKMCFSKPMAYQLVNGKQQAVAVRYQVQGKTYGFTIGHYDTTKELVIDPLITSFPIQNGNFTDVTALAADSTGNIYAAGFSGDYCVIYKLDAGLEKVLAANEFGGGNPKRHYRRDMVTGIALDKKNNVYVCGYTESYDFPIKNGFDDRLDENDGGVTPDEGFVVKFKDDLTLLASTFIGGDFIDRAMAIATDANDKVYVAGYTVAADMLQQKFPVTQDAYDRNEGPPFQSKAYVARIDKTLSKLEAATLLGGNSEEKDDEAHCIAIDPQGFVWVAGQTESDDFPTTANSVKGAFAGKSDAFAAKFTADLKELKAATFLGGVQDERATAIVMDVDANVYVAGWTNSSDFPIGSGKGYDTSYNLGEDGFVVKLDSSLSSIQAGTFIGGKAYDGITCMALSSNGMIHVAGRTASENFPMISEWYESTYKGGEGIEERERFDTGDGFISIFNNTLTDCIASAFLGGSDLEYIDAIIVNKEDVLAAGETWSGDFPLMRAERKENITRGFISRFNTSDQPPPDVEPDLSGNWQMNKIITNMYKIKTFYLDIDICSDGSFSGIAGPYACIAISEDLYGIITYSCKWQESFGSDPVSGNIDFKKNNGTIKLPDCKESLPFKIKNKFKDEIMIDIEAKGHCDFETDFSSTIFRKGEAGDSCKGKTPADNPDSPTGSSGGGGGCFIDSIIY